MEKVFHFIKRSYHLAAFIPINHVILSLHICESSGVRRDQYFTTSAWWHVSQYKIRLQMPGSTQLYIRISEDDTWVYWYIYLNFVGVSFELDQTYT